MLDYTIAAASPLPRPSSDPLAPFQDGAAQKRKRKPAGTPDPDAEVVSLSPKTLLESDRYVCEICNQGFQRDQNLQMHRRRHKVPWKLLKRESSQEVKKRVFVCPEPSCLHHDPCHALGDLVGIKKHFRRKHSNQKQWVCDKCGKGYAVQSDFKAHLKTCGTRGHSCDCGRVFSRVESFIEHQDACTVRRVRPESQVAGHPQPPYAAPAVPSTSPLSDINFSIAPKTATPLLGLPMPRSTEPVFLYSLASTANSDHRHHRGLELQLLPSTSTHLKLSIGSSDGFEKTEANKLSNATGTAFDALKELAMSEKAYAERAREEAKRQVEIAELEFSSAKRIRQQAQGELERAQVLKVEAVKKINAITMQITCQACKHQFQTSTAAAAPADETSLAMSYMSSASTEGEGV
ncbi:INDETERMINATE(ID)-DOMAIN 15, SHOOT GRAVITROPISM 5, ARABIDOPSIS THALIANA INDETERMINATE(ID)-DOMAIN 15 [Hibiscus trionum]|uniref:INDETERMINATE(ID)-DOMAIN 15, SHOOT GRAVITROPISM 5, ARABIDOPSIS THALIANA INDETERMINATE(ID)-DOMAIN 15 n=1 Tax=Hibiscus trionum TaxID=183268 RepID=A0A9W7HTT4_HIBTR|nr:INDETERMINATE(ID)-DOMAIN 15, SHOOT GRAVITROPISM 5, ARABIDOPSIS THALIANA INDETERMINATE(ID)-DOMAIN 15 [Hibiscus trionum]